VSDYTICVTASRPLAPEHRRYAHLGDDPLRRASETIGATIAAAMNGGVPKAACSATVVPIARAK